MFALAALSSAGHTSRNLIHRPRAIGLTSVVKYSSSTDNRTNRTGLRLFWEFSLSTTVYERCGKPDIFIFNFQSAVNKQDVCFFFCFFCRDFGILQGRGLLGTLSKTWHAVTFLYTRTSSWKSLSFDCYSRSLFRATSRNRWRTFQFRGSTNFVGFEPKIRKLWTHNGRKPRRPHFSHSAEGIISLSESGIKISPPPIYEGLLSIWHHDLLSLYLAS